MPTNHNSREFQNFLTAHGSRARRGGQVCVQGRRIPTWRGHQRVTIWRGHRVVPALRHGSVELIPRSVPKPRPSACPASGVRVVSPFNLCSARVFSVAGTGMSRVGCGVCCAGWRDRARDHPTAPCARTRALPGPDGSPAGARGSAPLSRAQTRAPAGGALGKGHGRPRGGAHRGRAPRHAWHRCRGGA